MKKIWFVSVLLFLFLIPLSLSVPGDLGDAPYCYLLNAPDVNVYTGSGGNTTSLPFGNITSPFPSNCGAGEYVYGFNNTDLFCRVDVGAGASYNASYESTYNATYDAFEDTAYNQSYESTYNATYHTVSINDPSDYDAVSDIPSASPSDGDTSHFSLADEIYDWVLGLGFLTSSYNATYDAFEDTAYNQSYESTYNATYDAFEDTDTQLSQEQVEDYAGAMVSGNTETGITVTYQDGDGTIDFVVTDSYVNTAGDSMTGNITFSDTNGFKSDNWCIHEDASGDLLITNIC